MFKSLKPFWPALPVLIIASGPPVVRKAGRSALATLHGDFDLWIVLQVLTYGTATALAILYLLPRLRTGIPARHGTSVAFATLLTLACVLSGIWSSAPAATMVLASMMGAGLFVAAQFANDMSARNRGYFDALLWLRWLSLILGLLVYMAYTFKLAWVAERGSNGLRIRGGQVAVLGLCGMVGVVVSAYRVMFMTRRLLLIDTAFIAAGLVALYYARTRSLFVALGVSLLSLAWFYFRDARTTSVMLWRLMTSTIAVGILAGLVLVQGTWLENQWTRGNSESISNLSSRTYIWGYTMEEVAQQPWGYGYSTGFRDMFNSMNWFRQLQLQEYGVYVDVLGEAHNSFLEFLVGPGWIGFLLYLGLLVTVWRRMQSGLRVLQTEDALHAMRICCILFLGFMADSLTTSAYALPLHQPFGYLVYVAALGLAIEAGARREARRVSVQGHLLADALVHGKAIVPTSSQPPAMN